MLESLLVGIDVVVEVLFEQLVNACCLPYGEGRIARKKQRMAVGGNPTSTVTNDELDPAEHFSKQPENLSVCTQCGDRAQFAGTSRRNEDRGNDDDEKQSRHACQDHRIVRLNIIEKSTEEPRH